MPLTLSCDAMCSVFPRGELAEVLVKRMIIAAVKFICPGWRSF